MAAYLNRTISLVTGNGTQSSTSSTNSYDVNSLTDPMTTRQLHNANDNSPLQIFVKAKKRVNDIFGEIEEYVIETARFIDGKLLFYFFFFFISYLKLKIKKNLYKFQNIQLT